MSSVTGSDQVDHCDPDSIKQVCRLCLLQSFPFHSFIMSLIAHYHYRFRIRSLVTQLIATVWAWMTCDCIPPLLPLGRHRFQTLRQLTRLGFKHSPPACVQTVLFILCPTLHDCLSLDLLDDNQPLELVPLRNWEDHSFLLSEALTGHIFISNFVKTQPTLRCVFYAVQQQDNMNNCGLFYRL